MDRFAEGVAFNKSLVCDAQPNGLRAPQFNRWASRDPAARLR